jgi:hypothetical protein
MPALRRFIAFAVVPIVLVAAPARAAAKPAGAAPRATPILTALGYEGFLAELRACDAVVTLRVMRDRDRNRVLDSETNSLVSLTIRAEVTDVFKGDAQPGDVIDVSVPYQQLGRHPARGLGLPAAVPMDGQSGTFLLARDGPWRARNVVDTRVEPRYLRAYVTASAQRDDAAALQLAELFCATSFRMMAREGGPPYEFTRTLVEDVKRYSPLLDAKSPAVRRLVARHADEVFAQCEKPALLYNAEGWDAVVWLASCMDDAGRRKAVRGLVSAYDASAERVAKLPPRLPPRPPVPGRMECARAPDPHDTEAIFQVFLLCAMRLVMDPSWRDGPPGDALGHFVPHGRLVDTKVNADAVLPAARAFATSGVAMSTGRRGE